jgi:hypothetical protein
MPNELKINSELGYVHLIHSGIVDLAERQKAKTDVIAMCFEKSLHRALVDLRDSNIQMSESDAVRFASSFKNTKLPDNYRLACIIGADDHSDNIIEIILALDGINIKYFFNFEEAESWLAAT